MDVLEKKLSEVKPYEKNPRKNDEAVKALKESIKEFGFKQPIVIDKSGVIVAGHTRYKAAKELGMKTIPCIVADDLTPEQVKAFRLADNKVGEIAEWDFPMLDEELKELSAFEVDMSAFGFDLEPLDWDEDVPELSEESYEEPEEERIKCPHCGHEDRRDHFIKVKGVGDKNQNTNA